MNICICEDEKTLCDHFAQVIQKEFANRSVEIQLHKYYLSSDLIHDLPCLDSSIFFLDIDMPDVNGIKLASYLRKVISNREIIIIYISNKEELVFQSLLTRPLRFIRKSHFSSEIHEAVSAILNTTSISRDIFRIDQNGKIILVKIAQICYIESQGRIQFVHTASETYNINSKLSDIEAQLSSYGFLRIHKSILVNWKFIYSINKTCVILESGEELPLSKHRLSETKKLYQQLLEKNI